MVDHNDEVPCSGKFLLHQGVQRRIAITICHESGSNLIWKDVREVVIGKLFLFKFIFAWIELIYREKTTKLHEILTILCFKPRKYKKSRIKSSV